MSWIDVSIINKDVAIGTKKFVLISFLYGGQISQIHWTSCIQHTH
jgi:hypothetical protein